MRLLFLTMQKWKQHIRWIEWLLALGAMGYLIYRLITYQDYAALTTYIQWRSHRVYVLLAIVLLLVPVQLLVEAARWRYLLRGWQTISMRESWSEVMIGMVAGFITPYRSGDIPARLVASGLAISKDELLERWHRWIKDWHKWFAVVGYTLARHVVWGVQLWLVLEVTGIHMQLWQGVVSIALYYVVITFMPALPAADVAIKGGWAVWIFGQYTDNVAAIMVAVSLIWIFNTIIPVLFGSLEKILYFCKPKQ